MTMCRSNRRARMRSIRPFVVLAALAIALPPPAKALAQPATAPAAPPTLEQVEAARIPFREARELHRHGRLNDAVARMLDAYQIASTPVIALEAGRFLVEAGQLVKARDLLRGVAGLPLSPRESIAGRDARRDAALLAMDLGARIPKLAVAERAANLDVLLDGKPFAPADSVWQGVDPGEHTIVVGAHEHLCATIAVTLAEGQERTVDLRDAAVSCRSASEPVAIAPAPLPAEARPAAPVPAPREPVPAVSRAGGGWPWAGAALVGAGVTAVGVGVYVIARAKSDYDAVGAECSPSGCDASAFDVRHRAHEQANVATAVAGVGAAALGGGLLWLVLGHGASPRVEAGIGHVSLVVGFP
jgi:hypothetical protein